MLMDLNTPSNAEFVKAALKESESIDLYPEEEKHEKTYSEMLFETYDQYQGKVDAAAKKKESYGTFMENVKSELLTLGLFHEFVEPVLENFTATSHEKNVGYQTVSNFVKEHGVDSMLHDFKYKNLYLAEIAHDTIKKFESIKEGADCKIKEGLPEDDIYEIEDREIEDYLLGLDDKIPKDISGVITKRVQNALDDFIDDKKKMQFEIKQIYQKAKEKVQDYNQAQAELNAEQDPDMSNDVYDAIDAQNAQDAPMDDDIRKLTPEQEATSWANSQISHLLESSYNVFEAMTRVMVESVHKIPTLQEYYQVDSKLDSAKIMHDVRAMYTFLEACNTLNIVKVDEDYIVSMIKDMYKGME